ncbi:MAG: DUF4382 domain-containing protein [Bacteroidetes bacterium]|nr:DUF4382 domain-containing protein [Bacteroidota bacterium]
MKGIKRAAGALLFAGIALLSSCDKNNTASQGSMYKVRMTDAPAAYAAVNVEIKSVQLIGANGETATLNTNTGIYNVLNFNNGTDTLIASGNVNISTVKQVKLVLGTNNSVVSSGSTYNLAFSSTTDATVTLDVNQTVTANGTTELIVDFDANASVQASGSGSYTFTPTIRPINVDASASGIIMGHVSNTGIVAVVSVTGNGHTYSTSLAVDGYFRVRGLATGSYTVTVTPLLPLQAQTKTGINVTSGSTTDIGVVTL